MFAEHTREQIARPDPYSRADEHPGRDDLGLGIRRCMKLAINYSNATADLLRNGIIGFDYFKCPAWPDLVATASMLRPVNVHFPLLVGTGEGPLDGETGESPDWARIESLLSATGTPLVNVHLVAPPRAYTGVPLDTDDPAHIAQVTERLIADVSAVVRRFGADRVIAENNPPNADECLRPALLPEVAGRVVRATGCGLLLDLAHVRLAAVALGMDARDYARLLPTGRIREIHVAGVQRIEGRWLERMLEHGVPAATIERLTGRMFDHLPMTEGDWTFFEWALAQIRSGAWRAPWIITFEYGGVGSLWEAITDGAILQEQIPRLQEIVALDRPWQAVHRSHSGDRLTEDGADFDTSAVFG
jgi:uncharacterized protein (UPF0276 family)